jgi:DNA-binding LacI/PurR family transcriptional regulator
MASRRITQKLIARRLGVSQAAVSYVLGGKADQISPAIGERILAFSRKCGYFQQTRRSAHRPQLLAFIVAREGMHQDVFHARLLEGIQEGMAGADSLLVHHVASTPPEALARVVSGAIVATAGNVEMLKRLRQLMPIVVLNDRTDLADVDGVRPDNAGGIRQAMTALHAGGHRRFAFFAIRDFGGPHGERYEAFLAEHARLGLPAPDPLWLFTPERTAGTVEEMNTLIAEALTRIAALSPRPTALICPADLYAAEFIRISREFGLRIPQDLSITGFDDLSICRQLSPTLSSVAQPLEAMGREAARLLLSRITEPELPARHTALSVTWMPRDSTGPVPSEG